MTVFVVFQYCHVSSGASYIERYIAMRPKVAGVDTRHTDVRGLAVVLFRDR